MHQPDLLHRCTTANDLRDFAGGDILNSMDERQVVASARPGESPARVHLNLKPLAGQALGDAGARSRTEWISIALIVGVVIAFVLMIGPIVIYALIAGDPG